MGELTEVASAKRAVLGVWRDMPDRELEEVPVLTSTWVVLMFSSGWVFDMLSDTAAS